MDREVGIQVVLLLADPDTRLDLARVTAHVPAEDPQPALFEHYAATLQALAANRPLEPLLRAFEWRLLDELGYGFALDTDLAGQPIAPDGIYRLQPDAGLEPVAQLQPGLFQGRELLALADADYVEYREKGRFSIDNLGRPSWAHPIVAGGVLYIRNMHKLTAYDVRAK